MKITNSKIAMVDFDPSDFILYETFLGDSQITLNKMKGHFSAVNRLTGKEKHLALVNANDLLFIDNSALQYMSTQQEASGRIASAFYSKSLANRLTLICFKIFYKPAIPVEFFTNKMDAMQWLKAQKVSYNAA
jgi:hypothetical protein